MWYTHYTFGGLFIELRKDLYMLNEEKIRWMTKASIYEKRQGRIDLGRNEYFMGDYVRLHLLKNGISLTIAYILLAGLYFLDIQYRWMYHYPRKGYYMLYIRLKRYLIWQPICSWDCC